MCEDYVRFSLQRLIITSLESVAFFRRANQGTHVRKEIFHFDGLEFRSFIQQLVNANDEL